MPVGSEQSTSKRRSATPVTYDGSDVRTINRTHKAGMTVKYKLSVNDYVVVV